MLRLELGSAFVRVDARQLEQVLLNLTLNARDAMPGTGRLMIATSWVPSDGTSPAPAAAGLGYARLVVQDTGVGMDPATLERAFEPFFTTKEVGQGTGLGLSVVDGLVHQMGGTIRVVSAPGRGATFSVYLPLAAPAPTPASRENLDAVGGGAGRVMVVVEDEPSVRATAVRTLHEAGYTVHEAEHGGEALDLIRRLPRVDLVIADLGMPVMGGETLGNRLRVERPEVPILYISGYTDSIAVSPFLPKPFAPDALLRSVAATLQTAGERAPSA
jgi:CheY-like chemotaxis protein